MAFFLPVLAVIGGGSAVAGGVLAATAVAGGLSAYQQYKAGKITEQEYKLQAKQEGDAARQREIERRRGLLSALSSQNAQAGAQGVALAGSPAAMMNRDIKDFRNDLMYDQANTKTSQRILRSRGSAAAAAGKIGAIQSIVDTGSSIYQARG